jgi:hypothetical protein
MPLSRLPVLVLLAALAIAGTAQAQTSPDCPIPPADLSAMRDCYRPLLVFSPGAHDPTLLKQQALLDQYADDMLDRFLLYVPVLSNAAALDPPLDAPYAVLSADKTAAIRRRFHIAPTEFVVVLLGEDGTEKLRTRKPVSVLELDKLIDSMPGRKQEMGAH